MIYCNDCIGVWFQMLTHVLRIQTQSIIKNINNVRCAVIPQRNNSSGHKRNGGIDNITILNAQCLKYQILTTGCTVYCNSVLSTNKFSKLLLKFCYFRPFTPPSTLKRFFNRIKFFFTTYGTKNRKHSFTNFHWFSLQSFLAEQFLGNHHVY